MLPAAVWGCLAPLLLLLAPLASGMPKPDVVVAKDNSGNYSTIQAAINALKPGSASRWTVLYIKGGTYLETVTLPGSLHHIAIFGDTGKTVISSSHWAGEYLKKGAPWVWSAGIATVTILGSDITVVGVTFQNTHGNGPHGSRVDQAVALQVNGTRFSCYNCSMLAYQDTLYAATGLQYYKNCVIRGRVDFIFGFAKAFFENCDVGIRQWGGGVFAQGKRSAGEDSGFVMKGGSIHLDGPGLIKPSVLGRAWGDYSVTVLINVYLAANTILPAGWTVVKGFTSQHAVLAEWGCKGPGCSPKTRRQLTTPEAVPYAFTSYIYGKSWIFDPSLINAGVV